MPPRHFLLQLIALTQLFIALLPRTAAAHPYQDWKHSGTVNILTTPDGANLPAGAVVEAFPLLVRLSGEWFDFKQAQPNGADLRFADAEGAALPYEIDEWNVADQGSASSAIVWVRVPRILGNARQELRVFWGKADAAAESSGAAVFQESNGYLSVWHLGDVMQDVVGTLETKDVGTSAAPGMVGLGRHFGGKQGLFGGEKIAGYPAKDAAHTTSLWFRAERPNGTVIGWGNEGGGRGSKVRMQFRSPPHIKVDSDFSDIKSESRLPMGEWIHLAHTYGDGPRRVYINGKVDGEATTKLDIKSPARLWLGGWYHQYDFVGDLDEVRVSKVMRSADWVRLEYENQKPGQMLVGPIVRAGTAFTVSPEKAEIPEGGKASFSADVGGAQKLVWSVIRDGSENVLAVDQFTYEFEAGRVVGDTAATLRLKVVGADGVKTKDIPISIKETIPEPEFTLRGPAVWDGRQSIEIVPVITKGSGPGIGAFTTKWTAGPFAVTKEVATDKLTLKRAQNSGKLLVTATISNGGQPTTQSLEIAVTEPPSDPWVVRQPDADEKPLPGQFYARDATGLGTLVYNGKLETTASLVFLRLYADGKLEKTEKAQPAADGAYRLSTKLKSGLINYHVEFGADGKILETVANLVCGDAYIIQGQSNALATDTHEKSPPETSPWIRSYGKPTEQSKDAVANLWCNPVWKAEKGEQAELGWWGMELAKKLVASQKMPIFIINGAVGGTRIDQHQRNPNAPTDLSTIYGRMLWRVQQARLTHGIRAIIWHQGENDQGTDGPTGGYGWEAYQPLFLEMAAGWKQDFPNVQQYYVFQIWPNSCSMADRNGSGDRLREKQRTLPQLFSHMTCLSTLGVRPPGGCHFPLPGWAEFANSIHPLLLRDIYGQAPAPAAAITSPNLCKAFYTGKDTVALEFDQPVMWSNAWAGQFYLDGAKDRVASGSVAGNVLTLQLKPQETPNPATGAAKTTTITYLKETNWSQETLLVGENGIAALSFCEVPVLPHASGP